MSDLLTVIVPVYNDEANILRCLDSLFNQTFKAMQVIVVNDASTDNTLSVLRAYQKKHNFQIICMPENSGAGHCRNAGIQAAQAPYVTFVDSDDWVDMSVYTQCFSQSDGMPDVIIYGLIYDYILYDRRDIKYRYPQTYQTNGDFALSIYAHTIPNEINITPIVNNKIYRKQFLLEKDVLFQEELRYQEDDVFTFEALSLASTVVFSSGGYYHYCQRSDSLIHVVSDTAIRSFVSAYSILEARLKERGHFEKYKDAFYLKLKGSLIGVLIRILDYESDILTRNRLVTLLLSLVIETFDTNEILNKVDFLKIRRIL